MTIVPCCDCAIDNVRNVVNSVSKTGFSETCKINVGKNGLWLEYLYRVCGNSMGFSFGVFVPCVVSY